MAALSATWTDKTSLFQVVLGGFFSQALARLTYKTSGFVFLLLIFFFFQFIFPKSEFAFTKPMENFNLYHSSPITTSTVFDEDIVLKTQTLNFKTKSVADPNVPEGESKLIQEGITGKKVIQTKTVFHNGQKLTVENSVVSETKPVDEIIAVHPSVLEKTIETPFGTLKFSEKLNVWATSYDPNCRGCSTFTSIGLKAGYGVVAVDPKVIPLRSKVYIPGYGVAIAGDTGGAIKGNKIDLGFDDVKNGNWSARFTDLYILSE